MEAEKPRILVVDDKAENRLLIAEYLDDLDIVIEEAESGRECLEMLKSKVFTLVILDIQMPHMDGFEVLAEMRKDINLAEIPVVFISAIYDSDQYILKGIEGGAIDFIAKPVNILILKSKVSNFLKLYEKQDKLDQMVRTLEGMNMRLQESEKKFKRITQSANDAIIVLNSEYKITFWNHASKGIFGYVKYEIITENFIEKLISEKSRDVISGYFKTLLGPEKNLINSTIRITGINKLGVEFPIELSLAHFTTAANEINYTVIIRDITHRVRMEKEALRAKELSESNKVMKEFMDNVSHELRTPMNAILGISNMLLKYNSENLHQKQYEGLQIINQSGTRLLDLINDVLDLSRLEANKVEVNKENFSLETLLASLRSLVISLIGTRDIKFHIRKSSNLPDLIKSDMKKVTQILVNLLGNAVKFTNEGKIILYIHVFENKLYFEVSDTGVGISEENIAVIFEKFRQIDNSAAKEYKGTGLGLNICKNLVDLLGGEISADSILGEGTVMKFYLPINEEFTQAKGLVIKEGETAIAMTHVKSVSKLSTPLAIIIEFNKDNNFWYSNLLKGNGYETISSFQSSVGFLLLKKYLPDLLVLKLEMPKLHGHFILNQIATDENLRQIPIIVVTSVEGLTLQSNSNPLILLHEPVREKELLEDLVKIQKITRNRHHSNKLFLYEKTNNLKDFINEPDECFYIESLDSARIALSRRNINYLIFDGLEKDGLNHAVLKWLKENKEFLPGKIYVICKSGERESINDFRDDLPEINVIDSNEQELTILTELK